MRVAIISDVHSNLEALSAVLRDMAQMGVERVYCLGDVVGYGPEPLDCLMDILENESVKGFVMGNHDHYVVNFHKMADEIFELVNENAAAGIVYSRQQLVPPLLEAMASWPERLVVEELGLSLAHGSFADSHCFRYLNREDWVLPSLDLKACPTKICVVGHTHCPGVYRDGAWLNDDFPGPVIIDDVKTLINVGSVGQPRDRDKRACYGLFTFEERVSFSFRRIDYDVKAAIKSFKQVGLPAFSGQRLLLGR